MFKWYALSSEARRGYGSAVKSYVEFCRTSFTPQPYFPANATWVDDWLAWLGYDKAGGKKHLDYRTVDKYRFSLRSYHVDLGLPFDGVMNQSTTRTIEGIKNFWGGSTKRSQALPIILPLLRQLIGVVRKNPTKFGGTRSARALIAAWALLWAGWMRAGELVFSGTYNEKRTPSRADFDFGTAMVHVPCTKITKAAPPDVCPIRAIESFIRHYPSRDSINTPLLSFEDGSFSRSVVEGHLDKAIAIAKIPTEGRGKRKEEAHGSQFHERGGYVGGVDGSASRMVAEDGKAEWTIVESVCGHADQ